MKQTLLRGIDARLDRQLKREAARQGKSLNKTIISLLKQATGLEPPEDTPSTERFHDLDHLAATWSAAEARRFHRVLACIRAEDKEIWK